MISYGGSFLFDVLPLTLAVAVEIVGATGLAIRTELRRSGRVGSQWLRDHRRHAAVVVIALAAIVTPPDVVSQLRVAIPAYVAFEALIAWVALGERRQG